MTSPPLRRIHIRSQGYKTDRISLVRPPTSLYRVFHHPEHLASCVTPSVITSSGRGRNVYLLSIGYALRPHLRSRLTLGGLTFPRKPRAFGERVSHAFLATYAGILTSVLSTMPHGTTSPRTERSPTNYHAWHDHSEASAPRLAPYIIGAGALDQ